jgi:hypothetical protein
MKRAMQVPFTERCHRRRTRFDEYGGIDQGNLLLPVDDLSMAYHLMSTEYEGEKAK